MGQRSDISLAMIASIILHGGLLAGLMLSKPWERNLPLGTAVPVEIVSNSDITDLRAAAEAAQAQQAQAPAPDPQPEPAAAPPEPAPPPPTPKPPEPVPDPARKAPDKTPAKPAKPFDLSRLARDIAKLPSAAQPGPSRPQLSPVAHPAAGPATADLSNAISGLSDELGRQWNPNCQVEGGRDVKVRAAFNLGPSGQVVGAVDVGGLDQSPNPIVKAGAERAIRAIYRFAPFPPRYHSLFGQRLVLRFDAARTCDQTSTGDD